MMTITDEAEMTVPDIRNGPPKAGRPSGVDVRGQLAAGAVVAAATAVMVALLLRSARPAAAGDEEPVAAVAQAAD